MQSRDFWKYCNWKYYLCFLWLFLRFKLAFLSVAFLIIFYGKSKDKNKIWNMKYVLFVQKISDKTYLATRWDTKTTPTIILYKHSTQFSFQHNSLTAVCKNVGSSVVENQNLFLHWHCLPLSLLLSEGEENWSCRNGTCGDCRDQQPGQAGLQRGQHNGHQAGTLQE